MVKFRVWDKQGRRFYSRMVMLSQDGRVFIFNSLTDVSDSLEIDKWTGLKDTYGKDIYENDIVVWGHHCPECRENPIRIAVVKIDPDIQFHEIRMNYVFEYGCFAYKDTTHLEVVGNIRENPEALEDPNIFLNKVFKPLDRFLIFPKSEKGKVKGFLLYEGENFIAYGYGNRKTASSFHDRAIPLDMEIFKRLLQVESPYIDKLLIRAIPITYMIEGEKVSLRKVENIETLPDDAVLLKTSLSVKRMESITYRKPYFKLSSRMEEKVRKHGLARFFLKVLDKVWEKTAEGRT